MAAPPSLCTIRMLEVNLHQLGVLLPPVMPQVLKIFFFLTRRLCQTHFKVLGVVSCCQSGIVLGIFCSGYDGVATLSAATVVPLFISPVNIAAAWTMKVCLNVWAALTAVVNVEVVTHVESRLQGSCFWTFRIGRIEIDVSANLQRRTGWAGK